MRYILWACILLLLAGCIGAPPGSTPPPGPSKTFSQTPETAVVLTAMASNTPAPSQTPSSAATLAVTPLPSPFPTQEFQAIEVEWPTRMTLQASTSIRVTLRYANSLIVTPTIEVEGNAAIVETPAPQGTPGLIQGAFGPGYRAFINANLAGAAFDVQAVTQERYELLNQSQLTWEWNVVPKLNGNQVLNVAVEVTWQREAANPEPPVQSQLWRKRLDTFVETPVFASGPIEVFPLVTALLGAMGGGLVTLLVDWLLKRKPKDKDNAVPAPQEGDLKKKRRK